MSTFELLSKNMQKKIWEMKWKQFTPIQEKAIPAILTTKKNIILSSATASGKTEAALLPILSDIERNKTTGLRVIYVSPLKALINNQFERVTELSDSLGVGITKWHGDVSASIKKKFRSKPTEILQITPESIESLFINYPNDVGKIFKYVEYVVIDEIHSFIGSDRGVHLQSLLSRVKELNETNYRVIGLSATIDDYEVVKKWVDYYDPDNVTIIEEKGSDKKLLYSLMAFKNEETKMLRVDLLEDIRELTRDSKAIIFCNSRSKVEEVKVFLNRLAKREGVGETYYAHHSSIDKKEREYVEKMMQEAKVPKSIVSTSTLELGIDIGSVDLIIQLDSTFSVSSLKQRLGRSGRQSGSEQTLQLYATDEDNLLQSLAIMELVLEKWIEPATDFILPYDIAIQQIISICAQGNGINGNELYRRILANPAFHTLEEEKVVLLVKHLIKIDILELFDKTSEVVVGIEGEKLLRGKDFYAIFMSPEEYQVFHGSKAIGQIHKTPFVGENDQIILAGQIWKIISLDDKLNKCYVVSGKQGRATSYLGDGSRFHEKIGEKIMELLCNDVEFEYIDEEASLLLKDSRKVYHFKGLTRKNRAIFNDRNEYIMETFASTEVATTIYWVMKYLGVTVKGRDYYGRIKFTYDKNIHGLLKQIEDFSLTERELLKLIVEIEPFKTKYSDYLPKELLDEIYAKRFFDLEETINFVKKIDWIVVQ
ncbi:DEAD/DEAH box helicase [Enterococcus quebecensis]|uniref:DEAD/DEAH box helicase n=1 Tax=Enterococcus quebecensis TaxID=903983 RepID=A0A1E5GUG5_9ENTE|nr:DEAD/DEAH box helicase [Enterococcus quebecensis]OEG16336.1 DEAD/DEAH box helicase [Enterococcus quebecensis]OJG72794.1 DEAD/DEAH box helicase [Enterococcus quebecensis]